MKILQLLSGIPYRILQGEPADIECIEVVDHSGEVQPGCLFLCLAEDSLDTAVYLKEAFEKGAAAALVMAVPMFLPEEVPILYVGNLKQMAGRIAALHNQWPSQHMHVIGITGTNGKTSTAVMTHHICVQAGIAAGLLGTIENSINGSVEAAVNTTPPAVSLQRLLGRMRDGGTEAVVMEVSSHALDQSRVSGIVYQIAVFTNLTQDHLDYHGTMEKYAAAKAGMFRCCRNALLNGDDPRWKYYAAQSSGKVYTYGVGAHVDFRASSVSCSKDGLQFAWSFRGEPLTVLKYPAPGLFQIYNVLAAASAAWLEQIPVHIIQEALDTEEPLVRGRFQQLTGRDGLRAIVDYAHTPDGLEQVLKTCSSIADGRIITVFGCGGNRDRGKRPLMGAVAARYSDHVIITSDNPRNEDPISIMKEIEAGIGDSCSYEMIEDREAAIQKAVAMAEHNDLILVAGKGHETVQWIRGKKLEMNDIQCVKNALNQRG